MSTEPVITCPKCGAEIKLTESLAAPLIESTKREYTAKMARNNEELAKREADLARQKDSLDQQVNEKLKQERAKIAAEESKKARLAMGNDLEQRTRELAELREILTQRDEKLAEAQKAQAELIRKQRELDDAKREMELTIETRVQESLGKTRQQAKKEAEDQLNLKVKEKEETIAAMQKQIEDLKRRADQGSQQLQGEALELELEQTLGRRFPTDLIEPVPKGEHGGDILQRVIAPAGARCGTILWEAKRTKNWSDSWLVKLREDQRAAKADVAALVTTVLPRGIETFDLVDGIWVTHPRAAVPVAMALRQMLIEVSSARQAGEGQQTKMEMVYQYLVGPKFRLRVQAIVEAFTTMAEDLQKEKKALMKQWEKRDAQIHNVLEATVGMYGELQGIAGKTLQEIEGLDMKMLGNDTAG